MYQSDIAHNLAQIARELQRTNELLAQNTPQPPQAPDWEAAIAWRWRAQGHKRWLAPVTTIRAPLLADLQGIDEQKARLVANTARFVLGQGANNVLLSGARGTGKSSLIKAVLQHFAPQSSACLCH